MCRNECTKSILRFLNSCYVSEFSEMYLGNRPSNWRRQATTKMRGELGLLGCLFSAGVCGLRHIDCQVPGSSGIQSEGGSLFAKQQRPSRKNHYTDSTKWQPWVQEKVKQGLPNTSSFSKPENDFAFRPQTAAAASKCVLGFKVGIRP